MILKNYILDSDIVNNINLQNLVGDSFSVQRYYSEEFEREYDVFKIESDNNSIIIKKTKKENEILMHKLLKTMNCDYIPKVYFIESDRECYWIGMEDLGVNQETWSKNSIKDLVAKIAHFHTLSKVNEENDKIMKNIKKWSHTPKEILCNLEDSGITKEHIELIEKSETILMKSFHTFIHGDMIPLNIIVTPEGTRIIDWEHGQYGPCILDLGRLLGDFNIDKHWINLEWEDSLLEIYHESIKKEGVIVDYNQMYLEYQCAKLHNYFGIIKAFKTRKWEKTDWYYLNLKEMLKTISKVKEILTNRV